MTPHSIAGHIDRCEPAWTTNAQGVLFSRYDRLTGSGGWSAPEPVAGPANAMAIDLAGDGLGGALAMSQMTNAVVDGTSATHGAANGCRRCLREA
jgi:hypothetical protein